MRLEDRVPFDRAGFGTVMRNFVGNLGASWVPTPRPGSPAVGPGLAPPRKRLYGPALWRYLPIKGARFRPEAGQSR
jgi:hypothetical protein